MPLYEFECECKNKVEEITKIGTETILCPVCGKNMKKLMSVSSFHLKGNGWYATDYGKKSVKKEKDK